MSKTRLQNCKVPKVWSESWSTRYILESFKLFSISQFFFLKRGAYCFSFTSPVGLNSLYNSSNLYQKKEKKNQHFRANNSQNLKSFSYYGLQL